MDHAVSVSPGAGEIGPVGWLSRFDDMFAEVVAPALIRRELRLRARSYLLGLASGLERKKGGRWRSSLVSARRTACSGC
jgi:hypothetical protein